MSDAKATPTRGLSRDELMEQWRAARRRREAAALGSEAFRKAAEEIADIEVEIARIERAMNPPLV